MTEQAAAQLFESGDGRCEICSEAAFLVVDHDHNTDVVRGLLYYRCNALLGVAHDDPAVLEAAIKYLSKHPKSAH